MSKPQFMIHDCAQPVQAVEAAASAPLRAGELWTLIENMLAPIASALEAAGGIVRVISPDGQMLQIAGAAGVPMEICEAESIVDAGCGVCGKAAGSGGVYVSETAVCTKRSSQYLGNAGCFHVAAAPLEYHGRVVGILTLFFQAAEHALEDLAERLSPFTEMMAVALEHGKKNIEERRAQLVDERQAMANEIHDSLSQTLYYGRMRMSLLLNAIREQNNPQALKYAEEVNKTLSSGQKTIREIITHFRCQMDPLGLQYALQTLVEEFRQRTGITLTYRNYIANLELPVEHELQVLHIVREALANVAAHSSATRAELDIEVLDGEYVFTVCDNGTGYSNANKEGHYGLMIMRERSLRIGGEIEFNSGEGRGSCVRLRFPVPAVSAG